MRVVLLATLLCLAALASAGAQTPPAPDALSAPKTSASAPSKAHAKKPRHVSHAHPATADALGGTEASPLDGAHIAAPRVRTGRRPEDPLSFGMKWNANSDSARETRVQNYGGDAPGEGAEVGVKLHF